jgi:CHAD domain-containing protein
MRVTARRLRSILKTFRPLLDPAWAGSLRDELAWLADSLSTTRDNEVLLDRLMRDIDALPEDLVVGPVRTRLEQVLRSNLAAGRESIEKTLASERYVVLLERLVDAAWEPFTSPAGERPTAKAVPRLLRECWSDVSDGVKRLADSDVDAHAWHKVRIDAKRLRYSCEAAVPMFGRPAQRLAKIAAGLQDSLGENQDAVVASELLKSLATARGGTTIAFTLGLLHARQSEAGAIARAQFAKQWTSAVKSDALAWLGVRRTAG